MGEFKMIEKQSFRTTTASAVILGSRDVTTEGAELVPEEVVAACNFVYGHLELLVELPEMSLELHVQVQFGSVALGHMARIFEAAVRFHTNSGRVENVFLDKVV